MCIESWVIHSNNRCTYICHVNIEEYVSMDATSLRKLLQRGATV